MFWINGPFPAGEFSNVSIFCRILKQILLCRERVEDDKGYLYENHKVDLSHEGLAKKSAIYRGMQKIGFKPGMRLYYVEDRPA